jgi:hypothetical protein
MAGYPGVLAVIRKAAKKKRVRFVVNDFAHREVERLNNNVVIFWGSACQVIDRIFDCSEHRVARKLRVHSHEPPNDKLSDRRECESRNKTP